MSKALDIHQIITDQIVAMLEKGLVPWRSPILGQSKAGTPRNIESKKQYRGVSVFILAFSTFTRGFGSSYWLTFKQAKSRGGSVKKGEKASMVVFWKTYETEDLVTGKPKKNFVLRYYNVFNIDQCDGIKAPDAVPFEPLAFTRLEVAEAIVKGYADGPAVKHGGQKAFYRTSTDMVKMPEPTRFTSTEEYYSTLFHELSHSTGHPKRLDRKRDAEPGPFGSFEYSKEELIAEMAAAFLCGHAGITPVVIENQAAYIQGWLTPIREDKRLVIAAAGAAQRAADWIRGDRSTVTAEDAALETSPDLPATAEEI